MDWRLTPTPVKSPPPPAPLTVRSDPQAILQRLLESSQTWYTLWASIQQIDYGPPGYLGPPRSRYLQQAWIARPRRAVLLSSSGEPSGPTSIQYFLDGVVFWPGWGAGIFNADYIEEDNWFLKQFSLFPDLSIDEIRLTIQGEEMLAGRKALIIDLSNPAGDLDSRLWVDTVTGIVLRRVVFSPSSPDIVQWEIAVTALAYNQDFPSGLFNLKDPVLQGFARDPSGRPLESKSAFPTLSPWPVTGHEPLSYLLAPAGYDPSRQPVFLQWPKSWEGSKEVRISRATPSTTRAASGTPLPPPRAQMNFLRVPEAGIGVFASHYFLGSLPLQEVEFEACRRSPDGRRIALTVRSTGKDSSRGQLYWFGLEVPEKLVALGGIDGSSNSFVFSPDSRRLAYVTCDNLPACRWVSINLQTSAKTSYNIGAQYAHYLAWSPDGKALVILASSESRLPSYRLLVVDVQNGQTLYSTKYDPENPPLLPDAPLLEWGLEVPPTGNIEQGCMNP
jgi:hypothetical protein